MKAWTLPVSLLLLFALACPSQGNTRAPDPPKPRDRTLKLGANEAKLLVYVDEDATGARLLIPDTFVADIKELKDRDEAPDQNKRGSGLRLPVVVAAVALTLAFVTGGLWLVGRGRGKQGATLLLLSLILASGCGGPQDSNAPPGPDGQRDPRAQARVKVLTLPATVTLSEQLTLDIVDSQWTPDVTLIVGSKAVVKGE